uniref:Uncharacterized protein n=1 Tax=Escherichia coli TaxID=562 RepID=A0A3G4RTX6_ECOLX|nr:hypothetical protein D0368_00412 [Escherichia coli]
MRDCSFTQGVYFGVDTKKGTMLYARAYPGNIMDIIGFDIDNFTRTVTDAKTLEIYTKYINNTNGLNSVRMHPSQNDGGYNACNGRKRI